MTDISIPDQNQHDTDKPSRKRSASSNIGIMTLLMTDWEPISSEMIMRLVFAAKATMTREPNLAAHDARLQLAETSMGLAAESSNHDHKYVALGQARRHVARAEQELEYHPPIITGLMADEVMREAVNALLPAAITAALDSASMFYNSPETMAAAIYEGVLEAIETYDLDHGLKPSFWAYMVTTMKIGRAHV